MTKRVLVFFMLAFVLISTGCNNYKADNYSEEHSLFNVTYFIPESIKETQNYSNGPKYITDWGAISVVPENARQWDDDSVIAEQKKKSTRKNFKTVKVDGEPALYYEYEDDGKVGVVVHFNTNRSGCAVDIQSNESFKQAKVQYDEFISKVKIDKEKDKAINYTQKQTVDNITYYLPENCSKKEDSDDDNYYVDGGMISIMKAEYIDPKRLHNDNYINTLKLAAEESEASVVINAIEKKTINGKPVLCMKMELKEDKDNTMFKNLIHTCSDQNLIFFGISSWSLEDSELKYEEFLENLYIDDTPYLKSPPAKASIDDYKKEITIDNVTFYVPENCTEKDGTGNIKYYYYNNEDGSFIMTNISEYTGKDSWNSDDNIESFLSGYGKNIKVESHDKISVDYSPALKVEGEFKENGYTGYVQCLAFSTNKHSIQISVVSNDTAEDAKNKIEDVKRKIKIDTTQPYPTGKNEVIYSDNKVRVSFVEFDSVGGYTGPRIKLLVENKSNKTLLIQAREESVNGYMVDGVCSFTVSPGMKAKDDIIITNTSLEKNDISVKDIKKIVFRLMIADDNHWTDNYETKKITINI